MVVPLPTLPSDVAVESNPYSPTVPDSLRDVSPELYEYLQGLAADMRQAHSKIQAGSPTVSWTAMQALDSTPQFALGSQGSFINDTYGVFTGVYVKFGKMTDGQIGGPVTLVDSQWTATNDISKSGTRSILGILGASVMPANDMYGWVLTKGVNLYSLLIASAEPERNDYLTWENDGTLRVNGSGIQLVGRVVSDQDVTATGDSWTIGAGSIAVDCTSGLNEFSMQRLRDSAVSTISDPFGYGDQISEIDNRLTLIDGLNQLSIGILSQRVSKLDSNNASVALTQKLSAAANFANVADTAADNALRSLGIVNVKLAATSTLTQSAKAYRDEAGFYSESTLGFSTQATLSANNSAISAEASSSFADDSKTSATASGVSATASETSHQQAVTAAGAAQSSADASQTSAVASQTSADGSATSAAASHTSELNAASSAASASGSAGSASNSATASQGSASSAKTSADASQASATASETSHQQAVAAYGQANTAAGQAAGSATDAATSAKASQDSATASSASATAAGSSATTARGYSDSSSASAGSASTSATNAANSATAASGSAASSSTSAQQSSQYASNAADSATAAGNQASAAQTQAQSALTQAQNAANSSNASEDHAQASYQHAQESAGSAQSAASSATAASGYATDSSNSSASAQQYSVLAANYQSTAAQNAADSKQNYDQANATLTQFGQVLAGYANRSHVYWGITGQAGSNLASIELFADSDNSQYTGFVLTGNLIINGNLLVNGSVGTVQVANNAITNFVSVSDSSLHSQSTGSGQYQGVSATYTSQAGGTIKIDFTAAAAATSGLTAINLIVNGNQVAGYGVYSGAETMTSFYLMTPAAGTQVTAYIQFTFSLSDPNGYSSYLGQALSITEFKR